MKKRIKIQDALIFIAVILLILLTKFVIPDWKKEPLEELLDTLGIVFVLFGFLLRIVARGYKEEMSQGGNRLVTNGPYCLMRNPMYFGTLLIGIGITSVLLKLWSVPIFLIICLFIYLPQINREEKILLKRFGEDYKNYCKFSPKYFPNIRRLLNLKAYVPSLKFSWIKKEFFSLILTVIAIFIIEIWQDVALFGFRELFDEFLELSLVIMVFIVTIIIFVYGKHDN